MSSKYHEVVRLELTPQEVQAIIELLDLAVRARGLEVSSNATILANKIRNAPVGRKKSPKVVPIKKQESHQT